MRTCFTLFLGLALLATSARADFSRDLLAAYFFNGTGDDQSGRGQHAQLVGASFTADRHGNPDGALWLDGAGAYASTPVSGARFPISFSFWFRLGERAGVRPFSILDSGTGDAFGHSFVIGAGPQTFNANLAVTHPFAKGRWTHVAVTYGEKLKVYADGRLVAERDHAEGPDFAAGHFQIGRHYGSDNARYFHGAVDDVLIFARTLGDDDVRRLYEDAAAVEQHVALGAEAKARLAAHAADTDTSAATDASPRPILVIASDAAAPHTNAWHAFDGDPATRWDGAPDANGWWLAAEFHPPVPLEHLRLLHAEGSPTNALFFYSDDADTWPQLAPDTLAPGAAARFLLLTYPDQAPRLIDVQWTP